MFIANATFDAIPEKRDGVTACLAVAKSGHLPAINKYCRGGGNFMGHNSTMKRPMYSNR